MGLNLQTVAGVALATCFAWSAKAEAASAHAAVAVASAEVGIAELERLATVDVNRCLQGDQAGQGGDEAP